MNTFRRALQAASLKRLDGKDGRCVVTTPRNAIDCLHPDVQDMPAFQRLAGTVGKPCHEGTVASL